MFDIFLGIWCKMQETCYKMCQRNIVIHRVRVRDITGEEMCVFLVQKVSVILDLTLTASVPHTQTQHCYTDPVNLLIAVSSRSAPLCQGCETKKAHM